MSEQQVQLGQQVPDFTLPSSSGEDISLSQFRGQKVIIYFYPKDSTPACTQQACDFRDSSSFFAAKGAAVIGISADDLKSHQKFAGKHSLPFPLLADTEKEVSRLFGVWQLKKMYGREFEGIVRSTFLIDEQGILVKEWRKVKVGGHVDEVLHAISET
ncbi:thioredoxin-dependent thiol peroxidase [Paenibacillus zeisoli]|uniref:thioredoxin-dependent peroxiredoxin n=1 Tax=Paenibacillus zeisoli TaxID=2496267 RepID=A0A3S1D2Y0_9BACL|nr:thioredoxin-dependent thiol peroxidase [Paenibacillus zeisoli]RUT27687.1 thioredoxin-dependent thiol peroxidase [Paenibacillus zeisoli]